MELVLFLPRLCSQTVQYFSLMNAFNLIKAWIMKVFTISWSLKANCALEDKFQKDKLWSNQALSPPPQRHIPALLPSPGT